MLHTFDHLAEWPYTGRVRVEYAPVSYRFWVSGDYLILYNPEIDPIEIVTILHGAQDLADIIGQSLSEYIADTAGR